jgi:hypothetical protein
MAHDGVGYANLDIDVLPVMACGKTTMVHSTEEMVECLERSDEDGLLSPLVQQYRNSGNTEENLYAVHNIQDMMPLRYESSLINVEAIAVCGQPGLETIAMSSGNAKLQLNRGLSRANINMEKMLGKIDDGHCQIKLLGSDRFLIVLCKGRLNVFCVDDIGLDEVVEIAVSAESIPYTHGRSVYDGMRWSKENFEFAFWDEEFRVSIWGIHQDEKRKVSLWHKQTINDHDVVATGGSYPMVVNLKGVGRSAVVTSKYVAGTPRDAKKICVYERSVDALLHTELLLSQPIPTTHGQDRDDYPTMKAVGDLLVTSSHPGFMIRVWHMATGDLLMSCAITEVGSGGCRVLNAEWLPVESWNCYSIIWSTNKGFYIWGCPWDKTSMEQLTQKKKGKD